MYVILYVSKIKIPEKRINHGFSGMICGEGGIRTPGTVSRTTV